MITRFYDEDGRLVFTTNTEFKLNPADYVRMGAQIAKVNQIDYVRKIGEDACVYIHVKYVDDYDIKEVIW